MACSTPVKNDSSGDGVNRSSTTPAVTASHLSTSSSTSKPGNRDGREPGVRPRMLLGDEDHGSLAFAAQDGGEDAHASDQTREQRRKDRRAHLGVVQTHAGPQAARLLR